MVLQIGQAYGIPSVALRFFNIYGPRQALSNPYTGVAAIFSSRLLNGNRPIVFEDGHQSRDFVSVHDIVRALLLAAERKEAVGQAINVGSGQPITVRDVAATLARVLGVEARPEVTGRYRVGDIRHCYADISRARELLGYEPAVGFEQGMCELVAWQREQERPADGVQQHAAELAARGLTL
jgi:dTDP-L-rhamnose 4-epimerase